MISKFLIKIDLSLSGDIYSLLKNNNNFEGSPFLEKINYSIKKKAEELKRKELDLQVWEKELEKRESRLKELVEGRNNEIILDTDDEFDFLKKKPRYVIPDDSEIHFLFLYSSVKYTLYNFILFFNSFEGTLKQLKLIKNLI